jgi:riboflavin kinase / FMN adenylyltransferase
LEVIRGLHNLHDRHRGCALTIGNFDGVHLGHCAVIEQLRRQADGLPTVLMTFEPHPREFLHPDDAPTRITGMVDKLTRLAKTGLDRVLVVRFNPAFAELGPDAFVDDVLDGALGARTIVVGEDFRFGRGGVGDFTRLCERGARAGMSVDHRESFQHDGERVSSSRIRACLANGELEQAAMLLGAPYSIQGRVAFGRQLGRTIGFPTANVRLNRARPPVSGVFAVRVRRASGGDLLPGVANVGRRPTVNGEGVQLEVNLFDFDEVIYGERIAVELAHRIRPEQKFASLDALKEQIARDADSARTFLGVN